MSGNERGRAAPPSIAVMIAVATTPRVSMTGVRSASDMRRLADRLVNGDPAVFEAFIELLHAVRGAKP